MVVNKKLQARWLVNPEPWGSHPGDIYGARHSLGIIQNTNDLGRRVKGIEFVRHTGSILVRWWLEGWAMIQSEVYFN